MSSTAEKRRKRRRANAIARVAEREAIAGGNSSVCTMPIRELFPEFQTSNTDIVAVLHQTDYWILQGIPVTTANTTALRPLGWKPSAVGYVLDALNADNPAFRRTI